MPTRASDVAKFNNHQPEPGVEALVSYLRKLPRDMPAGAAGCTARARPTTRWARWCKTTKSPATWRKKVWGPAGMEQQATWL